MSYRLFHDFYPEIAERETRSATVLNAADLPGGEYAFVELYCTDPKCDCRRVIVQVAAKDMPGKILATLSYGWDTAEFYARTLHNEELAKKATTVTVEWLTPQTKYANALKEVFETIIEDSEYVERLKRHYSMVKRCTANPSVRRPKMPFRRK